MSGAAGRKISCVVVMRRLNATVPYKLLGDAGIARYMEYAAMHRYPGGHYPDQGLDQRLA